MDEAAARALAERFIVFLETGDPPEGLFRPDVFCDFTMPHWRLQARGMEEAIALRTGGHPSPGRVPRWRVDPTPTGFVLELEERWDDDGGSWYCREMFRVDAVDDAISELSVYCTGDWDEARQAQHARDVTLLRP